MRLGSRSTGATNMTRWTDEPGGRSVGAGSSPKMIRCHGRTLRWHDVTLQNSQPLLEAPHASIPARVLRQLGCLLKCCNTNFHVLYRDGSLRMIENAIGRSNTNLLSTRQRKPTMQTRLQRDRLRFQPAPVTDVIQSIVKHE